MHSVSVVYSSWMKVYCTLYGFRAGGLLQAGPAVSCACECGLVDNLAGQLMGGLPVPNAHRKNGALRRSDLPAFLRSPSSTLPHALLVRVRPARRGVNWKAVHILSIFTNQGAAELRSFL